MMSLRMLSDILYSGHTEYAVIAEHHTAMMIPIHMPGNDIIRAGNSNGKRVQIRKENQARMELSAVTAQL